tara:strand:- start:96 stop:368 length:273 start_codon:yes stop_codon:yes gene_type:complete
MLKQRERRRALVRRVAQRLVLAAAHLPQRRDERLRQQLLRVPLGDDLLGRGDDLLGRACASVAPSTSASSDAATPLTWSAPRPCGSHTFW